MAFSTRAKYTRLLVLVFIFTFVVFTFRDSISEGSTYSLDRFGYSFGSAHDANGHFDWSKLHVRNPVTSLHPLPTGEPLKLPRVQHDFSADKAESSQDKAVREHRKESVRNAFLRAWKSYKAHAWMADELVCDTYPGSISKAKLYTGSHIRSWQELVRRLVCHIG